jgi:dTDP-4-amino-4,6-dideoxygalactose transaminase
MIPIYEPYIKKYTKSAKDAIDSSWISNYGKYIELAGNKLKTILGVKHCILMNNGTSATHCLFRALKFKYPNITKLYVPNNVFVCPYNCALLEYSYDMLEVMKLGDNSVNIDTSDDYIITLEPNSAILVVHNIGYIVDVPKIKNYDQIL